MPIKIHYLHDKVSKILKGNLPGASYILGGISTRDWYTAESNDGATVFKSLEDPVLKFFLKLSTGRTDGPVSS